MATKFNNSEARFFNSLYKGKTVEEIIQEEFNGIERGSLYRNKEEELRAREGIIERVQEVEQFYNQVKLFDTPITYSLNGWGYGQTNYENMTVVGQYRSSIVAILDSASSTVFTIAKKSYTEKREWTNLDGHGVRHTSWAKPYTFKKIKDNSEYNAYFGH